MRIAVVGAGWAGLAAAVEATRAGHSVVVFEASRALGGRARSVAATLPDGRAVCLDNGQHILIGAYRETLRLMETVGVDPANGMLRMPLALRFNDGSGITFPNWPSPADALAGILSARGWNLSDKVSLLRGALAWQLAGFSCPDSATVTQLCGRLSPRIMADLIEPLCVSALNTPASRASGQVFLRVMRDSLFGARGSSNLLLPRLDLTELFPNAAAKWLADHKPVQHSGVSVRMATRVEQLTPFTGGQGCLVNGEQFDHAILATSATGAARLVEAYSRETSGSAALDAREWANTALALQYEAITTVYAYAANASLPCPMLHLRSPSPDGRSGGSAQNHPAQFAFDRGQLGGPAGLLAFVVSASQGDRSGVEAAVLEQARDQLGLTLQPVQTIVEKRATFACTPGLRRPALAIAPGLSACGDYCDGPYPATLEGAVRSAVAVVGTLNSLHHLRQ
jgi:hydroxysqualene dehydroxylase